MSVAAAMTVIVVVEAAGPVPQPIAVEAVGPISELVAIVVAGPVPETSHR